MLGMDRDLPTVVPAAGPYGSPTANTAHCPRAPPAGQGGCSSHLPLSPFDHHGLWTSLLVPRSHMRETQGVGASPQATQDVTADLTCGRGLAAGHSPYVSLISVSRACVGTLIRLHRTIQAHLPCARVQARTELCGEGSASVRTRQRPRLFEQVCELPLSSQVAGLLGRAALS